VKKEKAPYRYQAIKKIKRKKNRIQKTLFTNKGRQEKTADQRPLTEGLQCF
jgi:hypothetical protein